MGDILLSVILLFSELSPKSNLLCSPNINFRKTQQHNFKTVDEVNNTSMEQCIMDVKRKDAFQNSPIHLISFKTSYEKCDNSKIYYESIGKVEYDFDDNTTNNTLVSLENVVANPVDKAEILVLECIFGVDLKKEEANCANGFAHTFHFDKLLSKFRFWKNDMCLKKDNFTQLWNNLNMPDITKDSNDICAIVREAHDWFSFLTDFKISLIEGNHRLEIFTRLILGYNIEQHAPLRREDKPPINLPEQSTVFKSIPCEFYYQKYCAITHDVLKEFYKYSLAIQQSKTVYLHTTWQTLLRRIAEDIRIQTNYGDNTELVIDAMDWICTSIKDKPNEDKLINIHKFLLKIINDNFFEHEPAKSELKTVNRENLESELLRSTQAKFGRSSLFYQVVSKYTNFNAII